MLQDLKKDAAEIIKAFDLAEAAAWEREAAVRLRLAKDAWETLLERLEDVEKRRESKRAEAERFQKALSFLDGLLEKAGGSQEGFREALRGFLKEFAVKEKEDYWKARVYLDELLTALGTVSPLAENTVRGVFLMAVRAAGKKGRPEEFDEKTVEKAVGKVKVDLSEIRRERNESIEMAKKQVMCDIGRGGLREAVTRSAFLLSGDAAKMATGVIELLEEKRWSFEI